MGGGVKAPPPTKEEKALQKQQAELLQLQRTVLEEQRTQAAILVPFFAAQEGYDVVTDKHGNITGIKKQEGTVRAQIEQLDDQLQLEMSHRSLAALRGELPISPGLEKAIATQEQDLRATLTKQLGPGFETSTPGMQAMGEFRTNAEILREGARTNQLTLNEQLGLARQQQSQASRMTSQDFIRQIAGGDAIQIAGAFGQTAKGFGEAQLPFIKQREMQLQAKIANQQARTSMFGAGIGLVGALFSDDRLKSHAIRIGTLEPYKIPIYEYTYNGERYIGSFASDVERVRPGAVGNRYGYRVVQYMDL